MARKAADKNFLLAFSADFTGDLYAHPLARLNIRRYLKKIIRGRDKTGKQLSPIIKAKEPVIHEDFPEGFMEPDD